MNNYANFNNGYNYPTNILPNLNNNKENLNNYNQQFYEPYEGFIKGNMFPNLYNPYKLEQPYDIEPMNEQAHMLTTIDALSFATIDLNLYLDVYPTDQKAIDLFNQYRNQKSEITKMYESKFGPLSLSSDALSNYPWMWDNRPWPWEN